MEPNPEIRVNVLSNQAETNVLRDFVPFEIPKGGLRLWLKEYIDIIIPVERVSLASGLLLIASGRPETGTNFVLAGLAVEAFHRTLDAD